jgi:hypothetical protein
MTQEQVKKIAEIKNREIGYTEYLTLEQVVKSGNSYCIDGDNYIPNPDQWLYVQRLGTWYPVENLA